MNVPKTSNDSWYRNPHFQVTEKFYKDLKEAKIDELRKQIESLHLMMLKQPR